MDLDQQSADGRTVDVGRDETIALHLDENPTTGYRWQVTADPPIEFRSDEFLPSAGAGVGAGGRRVVTFRTGAAGEFRVRAKLWREWQGDSSVIGRCELVVRVSN
jgi:inhibitor of cysteine peptidase